MAKQKDQDIRSANLRILSNEVSQHELLEFLKNHFRVEINMHTDGADLTIGLRRKLQFPG